jgi:hypothetical protein
LNERSIDFGSGNQNGNCNSNVNANQRFTATARAISNPGTAYANSLYFGYESINSLQSSANSVNNSNASNSKIYNTLATPLLSQSSTRIVNNTGTNNNSKSGAHRNSTSSINRINGDNHDNNSDYSPPIDNQAKISPNNLNYKMNNSTTNMEWSKLVQTATKAFESN